jgi:3-deoxy-manno-octulosonate cytidylyltransferase (CMP-KDO synthetase)
LKTLGIIPARFASTRFPGKPLVDLCGKPMIQRVWERAAKARSLDALLVATDDRRIFAAVQAFGGEAVMTPASCASGTDRIALAARGRGASIAVNIQGDEPLLDPACIDQAVGLLKQDKQASMATLCHPLAPAERGNPNAVKVVLDQAGRALYFSRSPIPFRRDPQAAVREGKHIGLYAYRSTFLQTFARLAPTPLEKAEGLEQLRALENGYKIAVGWTGRPTQAVDSPSDALRVRKLILAFEGGRRRTERC